MQNSQHSPSDDCGSNPDCQLYYSHLQAVV
jgi:hypothetical protein